MPLSGAPRSQVTHHRTLRSSPHPRGSRIRSGFRECRADQRPAPPGGGRGCSPLEDALLPEGRGYGSCVLQFPPHPAHRGRRFRPAAGESGAGGGVPGGRAASLVPGGGSAPSGPGDSHGLGAHFSLLLHEFRGGAGSRRGAEAHHAGGGDLPAHQVSAGFRPGQCSGPGGIDNRSFSVDLLRGERGVVSPSAGGRRSESGAQGA